LENLDIQTLCVAWRQALRRIWKLPYDCHSAVVESLSCTRSLFDALFYRTSNFARKCLYSDSILVNFVSHRAVYCSRMFSTVGRNVQYYCERFGGRLHDVINNSSMKRTVLADDVIIRAGMIQELVMVRDGLL